MSNTEIHLVKRPKGWPTLDCFKTVHTDIPTANDGEFVIKTHYMSVDPYMRGRMNDTKSYIPSFALNEACQAGIVGEITESKNDNFPVGSYVAGMGLWANYSKSKGDGMNIVPAGPLPLSYFISVLGMPGMTAYVGLMAVAGLKAGDNVYVSAASGAVGQVVGQIAKDMGCHVSGSAGSADKVAYLTEELGFDTAFNYKTERDLTEVLSEANPKGIDVYFENVGGPMLEAVLNVMNPHGRIAGCGMIADYNNASIAEVSTAPRNMMMFIGKGIMMKGFIVSMYPDACSEWATKVGPKMMAEGKLKYRESVAEGIENAPQAFLDMLAGKNFGKQVIKLV